MPLLTLKHGRAFGRSLNSTSVSNSWEWIPAILYTLPDPNSPEHHDHILDCIVPYPLSRAFLVIEFTQASQGLVALDIQQCAPFLLRLKTLMTGPLDTQVLMTSPPIRQQSISSNLNTPSHYSTLIVSLASLVAVHLFPILCNTLLSFIVSLITAFFFLDLAHETLALLIIYTPLKHKASTSVNLHLKPCICNTLRVLCSGSAFSHLILHDTIPSSIPFSCSAGY
jgi:hypothetical protein